MGMGRILEGNYPFNRAPVYNQAPRTSFFPKSNHQSGTRRIARSLPWGSISRRPPRGLPSARPDHQPPRPSPPLTPALLTPATAPPRLRSRRPLSAAAAPRPSSIRPRRGRAPGFLHPCHAAAPRLATESHELAHAARLSHAGSLVLSPPPQPRALSRVLPRLASASSPTRAMNLLRPLALLQPRVFDMFSARGKV